MKSDKILVAMMMALGLLSSCNPAGVNDPPEFVNMFIDEANPNIVEPETRHPSGPKRAEGDYDEAIYSEADFQVIVVTNGPNYDLLYSVEVTDSVLGSCIYTDQSELYHASSTIIVESDQTYTTEVSLTIPGSTDHDAYLSDRTISLTKILFSRDTVDGTFPADIPENSDTILLFEVHAINYMDAELGFPVHLNDGKVDIDLTPDHPDYAEAEALAKIAMVIPTTLNGYPIGAIYLEDLDWVVSLVIQGGSHDIFLLGSFALLATLDFSNLENDAPIEQYDFKHVTLNGDFPVLTSISFANCSRYHVMLARNTLVTNERYETYQNDAPTILYDFPSLTTITFTSSAMGQFQIGRDDQGRPFPSLEGIVLDQSTLTYFYFGNEYNDFSAFAYIDCDLSLVGSFELSGSKNPTADAASLQCSNGDYGYITVEGSVFGQLDIDGTTIWGLDILPGTTYPSRLQTLILAEVTIQGMSNTLRITGDHPLLNTIDLTDVSAGEIIIGGAEDDFDSLQTISLEGVSAYRLYIGDRDNGFPLLAAIWITNCDFMGAVRIGFETTNYPSLTDLVFVDITAQAITLGTALVGFMALETVFLEDITLTQDFTISGVSAALLETIILWNCSMRTLSLHISEATYVAYIDGLTLTDFFSVENNCQEIFVSETDVTTWDYYDEATTAGITVTTGTHSV